MHTLPPRTNIHLTKRIMGKNYKFPNQDANQKNPKTNTINGIAQNVTTRLITSCSYPKECTIVLIIALCKQLTILY